MPSADDAARFASDFQLLAEAVRHAAPGQAEAVSALLTAFFSGGHLLLEGEPGTGKTRLALALAQATGATFRRLHLTPDMVSADITGTYVVMESQGRRRFEMTQGPVFANLVLAEEIQRASPKTQAALLEAMGEGAVTLGNQTYELPRPHLVVATQSPADDAGVYELPRLQLDRFMFSATMNPPDEARLIESVRWSANPRQAPAEAVISLDRTLEMSELARQIEVSNEAARRIARIVLATRRESSQAAPLARDRLAYGIGPRAATALTRGAQVRAFADRRTKVSEDDVRALAPSVLRHRLALNYAATAEGASLDETLKRILEHAFSG